jgi:hypothetical protein
MFPRVGGTAGLPLGYAGESFEWIDDFAAARNASDSLLHTDWRET